MLIPSASDVYKKWQNSPNKGNIVKFREEYPELDLFIADSYKYLSEGLMFDEALKATEIEWIEKNA